MQNLRYCYCMYSNCSSEIDYSNLLLDVVLVVDDGSLFVEYTFAAGDGWMIGTLFSTGVVEYWTDPDDDVVVEIVVEVVVVSLTLHFQN